MLTITRSHSQGYVTYDVLSDNTVICSFDLYYDAVHFVMTMQEIEIL